MDRGEASRATMRIGTSGWAYPPWRGDFYPSDLRRGGELAYLSRHLDTVEINASFYSLQRPDRYRLWYEQTPADFLFAVKGGRFITHRKKLLDVEAALGRFFGSGVLALGSKLGPVLWQLPPNLRFDPERLTAFFRRLPRSTAVAEELARRHDDSIAGHCPSIVDRPLRHALEVRHPSFAVPECVELLRAHDIGLVVADAERAWPYLEDVTSDFVYVRLHGDVELYSSGYTGQALDRWADLVGSWHAGESPRTRHTVAPPVAPARGRDVFVYFDNTMKGHAPHDAIALVARRTAA